MTRSLYPRLALRVLHRDIHQAGDNERGFTMKYHVIDIQSAYVVAYANHRGELVAVTECVSLQAAQVEAERLNAQAQAKPTRTPTNGNRYLRRYL